MSSHPAGGPAVPASRPEYFQNVASGNAYVGAQIAKNTGTVSVGAPPGLPGAAAAEIDRLLAALHQAHRRGDVGTDMLAEAEHEIETTRSALSEPDPGRAVRALRRLGGMVDGVAGLGALVGSVVAAVEGLAS